MYLVIYFIQYMSLAEIAPMKVFSVAVKTVLSNWTALQLAVEHQAGGPQSKEIAEWMTTVVENFIRESDDVTSEEIEEYVGDILNNELNTLCEDGSLEEVGRTLYKYYELAKNGKENDLLKELESYKGSGACSSKIDSRSQHTEPNQAEGFANSVSTVEEDIISTKHKNLRNEPDEDGWITVAKGKK